METNEPVYEWELSKENVQPLKAGRKLCNLSAALQPNSTDAAAKIKEEKQRFELELRTYVGDDPLSVWHSYILWMEQNYPKGNRAQLSQLLEQCMAQYKDEEKYKNDPRYLQLWIKFAQQCEDSQEIYSYMYNQGICSALAGFYQAWASELEALGNTKRANAIYQQGFDHCAQPTEWLLHRQSEFHARVVAQMASEEVGMDTADTGAQDVENRVSLGSLRAHGRKKRVGSVRSTHSKPAVLNVAGNLAPKTNAQGPAFSIYNEQENGASGDLPPQTKQWAKMPVRSEANSENEIKPGKWTNAKIRQHSVTTPSQPVFTIHQDAQQPGVTPRKINPEVSQVLSARKPPRQPHDPLSALTAVPGVVKQVPMYCKHLVYVGAEEFSLEEIRAAGMMKRQEIAEKKHAEEERLRMQEELRVQREEFAAIELQKQQLRLQIQQQQEALVEVDAEMAPQPPACTNASSSGHENSASDSMSTQRLLAFQLSPGSGSLTNRRTPDVSVSTGATPQHGVPQHGGLVAPSPTVNTKDAMRLVLGLFNQSIASATKWGAASNSNTSTSDPKSTRQADAAAGVPFTIFVDENPAPTKEQDVEDLENRAPPGYQNGPLRSLAGILQPATDIATEPIQYEEEMEDDILAQPLKDEDQDEPVKCMDGEPEFGDLTFAPSCSSTRNFTGMTKQLSASDILGGSVYGQPGCVTTAGTPSQSASSMTSQSTAMTTTTFGPSNLSCITERSDEDTKVSVCTTKEPSQLQSDSIASTASSLKSTTSVNSRALPQAHQLSPVSEPTTEDSVSRESFTKCTPTSSINQTCHEIDVSNYIAENCAADLLSQSVMVKPDNDPFDQDLITDFLGRLDRPINTYPMYHAITGDLPSMKARCKVTLGNKSYDVIRKIGEGAFAKVYEIRRVREEDRNRSSKVIKVQSPACPWEFYITHELHSRLDQLKLSMSSAFMKVEAAYISDTGSCLISELLPHGTILDVVNVVRASGKPFPEPLSVMVAIHLLRILEALRASDMIHGDVKPDNILFAGFPLIPQRSSEIPSDSCLQLIDFGRGIDMRMFPRNTTFSVGVETSGFQCVEMMTGRPWTYQVDMFGVVGTLAVVIFGSYMKVRLQDGRWKMNFTFKRWFKMKAAMTEVFDELLNVLSCTQLPDITRLRRRLETDFRRYHMDVYNQAAREFTARLSS